jgi:hypothetical protein
MAAVPGSLPQGLRWALLARSLTPSERRPGRDRGRVPAPEAGVRRDDRHRHPCIPSNVIAAQAEARRRWLARIATAGYDGRRVAGERPAEHVTRSEQIPRIQEAQASACHALRDLAAPAEAAA